MHFLNRSASLRDFIKEEYNYDRDLPTLSHNFVSDILSDIDTLDLAMKDYILSIGYEIPKDEEKDLKNIAKLSANFTNKYSYENTPVLKGIITNSRYIWHTNPNACQRCQDLDNTVYNKESDVPDKPHPNCKCSVEEIETKEDRCDCLDDLFKQIDNLVSSAENLLNEVKDYIKYFSDLLQQKVQNNGGRTIRLYDGTRFYGYVICDINDKIKEFAKKASLKPTPDSRGYFGYNSEYDCYIEIISFDKILADAKKRNHILFKKLGLEQ